MEYIRQWKVGDQVFASKAEAQEHEATKTLGGMIEALTVQEILDRADEVVALLKPFCTPKRRAPKGNGKVASKSAPKQPNNQPVA